MIHNLLKSVTTHIFIGSTAIAAALHSSWAFSTAFGGQQPIAEPTLLYAGWLLPGILIAFSLDIGMLATAVAIRHGQRSRSMYVTFGVLAAFIFYAQAFYLSAHTPQIAVAPGVSEWMRIPVTLFMDLRVIILPLMLPLSTTLYTFSYRGGETSQKAAQRDSKPNRDERRSALVTDMTNAPAPDFEPSDGKSDNGQETRLALPFGKARKRRK